MWSLKDDFFYDVEKILEVVMVIIGVDGEWSEEEMEFLFVFIYKFFVKVLVLGKNGDYNYYGDMICY